MKSRNRKWIYGAAAAVLIAVVLTCVLLIRFEKLGRHTAAEYLIENVFGSDPKMTETESKIPDLPELGSISGTLYASLQQNRLFDCIFVADTYIREFQIVYSSIDGSFVQHYQLEKSGARFRAVSDSRTIVSDGEQLWLDAGAYQIVLPLEEESLYREIGLTSLSDIQKRIQDTEHYTSEAFLSDSGNLIEVTIRENGTGRSDRYEIAIESGVVLSERSFRDGTAYRTVVTEQLDLGFLPDDRVFVIPDQP